MSNDIFDYLLIGFFIACIGFRKLPISKLDDMIKNNYVDERYVQAIMAFVLFMIIGAIVIGMSFMYSTFVHGQEIANHNIQSVSNYSLIKQGIILVLVVIWYFGVINPIYNRLMKIFKGDQ